MTIKNFFPSTPVDIRLRPLVVFVMFVIVNTVIFGSSHLSLGGTIPEALWKSSLLMGKTAGVTALFLLAGAFGRTLFRVTKTRMVSGSLEWAFALGIGLAILSLGTFFIAVVQEANIYGVASLLLPVLYFSRHELRLFFEFIVQKSIRLPFSFETRWLWVLWIFILSMFEFEFISSSATLLHADYDALHQYLTFPMEYLKHGGFTIFLWHPSWGFPQLGEMFFLLSAILFGLSGPFIANYVLMLILVAIIFQAMKTDKTNRLRHWLTACVASSPTLIALGSGALKIEMGFYVYCLLIFMLIKYILTEDPSVSLKNRQTNIFLGVFLGILLSIKYTAFFITPAILFALWVIAREKFSLFKRSFGILGIAFLVMSPWLVKNWMVYRSPLYPVLQGRDQLFLETGEMCSRYFKQYAAHDVILLFSQDIHQIGLSAVDNLQIFFFSIFKPVALGSMFFPGIWVTVFLLIMIVTCFQWKNVSSFGRFLALFFLVFFMSWSFFLLGSLWYFFPAWLAATLFVNERVPNIFVQRILMVVATLGILAGWFTSFSNHQTSVRYANQDISFREATRAQRGSASLEAYEIVNNLLREDPAARVYSFQEPIGYFIDHSSKKFVLDYYGEKIRCLGDDAMVEQSLKALNVKYILANMRREWACRDLPSSEVNELCHSVNRFEAFIEKAAPALLYSKDDISLYQLP